MLVEPAASRTSRHVADCDRCTRILEEATTLPRHIGLMLTQAVEPPPGFTTHLAGRVDRTLRESGPLALFADMLGAGWETALLMIQKEDDRGDD